MPILIITVGGGVVGYWDEQKIYHIRQSSIDLLIALGCNYRLVAIAQGQSQKCVKKLCFYLEA